MFARLLLDWNAGKETGVHNQNPVRFKAHPERQLLKKLQVGRGERSVLAARCRLMVRGSPDRVVVMVAEDRESAGLLKKRNDFMGRRSFGNQVTNRYEASDRVGD